MNDGANQEIEPGKFVVYSTHQTGRLSLGMVIKMSATRVSVATPHGWKDEVSKISKTPERLVQVGDDVAESMNKSFFDKMKETL